MKGRQHPVVTYHTLVSQADYVDAALRTFFQIHVDNPPGDVLIFLPGKIKATTITLAFSVIVVGQEDIEGLDKAIKMYAAQLPIQQMQVRSSDSCASVYCVETEPFIGCHLSFVRSTTPSSTNQNIRADPRWFKEVYISDEYS